MHRMVPDDLCKKPDETGGHRRHPATPGSAERAVSAPASCPSSRPRRRLPSSIPFPGRT